MRQVPKTSRIACTALGAQPKRLGDQLRRADLSGHCIKQAAPFALVGEVHRNPLQIIPVRIAKPSDHVSFLAAREAYVDEHNDREQYQSPDGRPVHNLAKDRQDDAAILE